MIFYILFDRKFIGEMWKEVNLIEVNTRMDIRPYRLTEVNYENRVGIRWGSWAWQNWKFHYISPCHSGLDPESRNARKRHPSGCRIKSGMTKWQLRWFCQLRWKPEMLGTLFYSESVNLPNQLSQLNQPE